MPGLQISNDRTPFSVATLIDDFSGSAGTLGSPWAGPVQSTVGQVERDGSGRAYSSTGSTRQSYRTDLSGMAAQLPSGLSAASEEVLAALDWSGLARATIARRVRAGCVPLRANRWERPTLRRSR